MREDHDLHLPEGFRAGAASCGLRADGGPDLGLIVADRAHRAGAVFTNNAVLGAHVYVCREHLARSDNRVRAILVNAKNANCATGEQGIEDARRLCRAVAARIDCPEEQVLMVSTGVIGAPLPVDRLEAGLGAAVADLSSHGIERFARAILTTDTRTKLARVVDTARDTRVLGVAKGSGMIHPDMATMLAFAVGDAPLGDDPFRTARVAADLSFHRISVDGDTSPNDTFLVWSSEANAQPGDDAPEDWGRVGVDLARQIAADGEGASRLVTIQVRGAGSEDDAVAVGRLIATSPLVKTAIAGRDPNWGRILSAAGRARVPIDVVRARVWVGVTAVYEAGRPWPEREAEASAHLCSGDEVVIGVDLAVGQAAADCWTCDLTADYVRINADYRT